MGTSEGVDGTPLLPAGQGQAGESGSLSINTEVGSGQGLASPKSPKAPVPLSQRSTTEFATVTFFGMCLSFNCGYINGCCLSGLIGRKDFIQSVAGQTATYTNAGLELAGGDLDDFRFHMSMVCCFVGGSFLSALINPTAKAFKISPEYAPTFLIGGMLLAVSSYLAAEDPTGHGLYYFASMANGLQNGVSSMYSASLIRTTHLTGTSTDIGLVLGQIARGYWNNLWKLQVLVLLAVAFVGGSMCSYVGIQHFKHYTFAVNACFYFAISMGCVLYLTRWYNIPFWQAATGQWKWKKVLDKLQATGTLRGLSDSFLLDIFDDIDEDNSGKIDESELRNAIQKAGFHGDDISDDGIKDLLSVADKNRDGVISREEWRSLIELYTDFYTEEPM
jgi:uncharacterized membrane protein YoaK (UPF0700 family)